MADFSVTSCTFSRSIVAPEDTIDITMTIKNTSGNKITKAGLCLCFTNADRGLSGEGWWAPVVQPETSCSWANSASKTLTWSITPDTIMSQPIYASIYASLKTRLASVRTLPFRLEIEGTGSDGSFASLIYTISGVQYIDKYYNPQITLDAWRYPNDEATALAATMRVQLAEGNNASRFTATMYYARDARATGNMPSNLNKTGAFTELTGSKYQSQSTYLGRGDILVTKTSGHTVVVLSNGPKYEGAIHPVEYAPGNRTLKYGCEGQDVKQMQEMLLKLGYDLGSWGCDGDFGDCTDLALRAFQTDAKLDVDGECGPSTLVALEKAVEALIVTGCDGDSCPLNVTIVGGNCYIRTAPNTDGKILGVAHSGDTLPYGGQVSDGGWLLVQHKNQNAWVSGKYGKIG